MTLRCEIAIVVTALFASACASTGAVPRPYPTPAGAPRSPAPRAPVPAHARPSGYSVSGTALALRGSPYRPGGADPSGFDCSGFVQYVFAQHAVALPRAVGEQSRAGHAVAPDALAPGDLVFFSTTGPGATHVGIAIGGDEFVHAPSARGEVRVERFSASYWASRWVGARRVL
jgi:cell wall-associated NlpC family hydrolase